MNSESENTIRSLKPLFGLEPEGKCGLIIAGPCSAESRDQVMATAEPLAAAGVRVFRAGVWKPRTRPGSFEGVGAPALKWLARVRRETGMKVITEVATPAHLRLALASGMDGIWLGARTVTNPFAVQELADAIAAYPRDVTERLTVLVKNPVMPDIELWIGSLERICRAGVRRLGAVHRGFGAYGENVYRNPPLWRVPIELHRRLPELPVLCDPSHIGGDRALVPALCHEACQMGFDGLMIETHVSPDDALSDAAQQITPGMLTGLLAGLECPDVPADTDVAMAELRGQIDLVDTELIDVLRRRMDLSRRIGVYKRENGIPVVQPERYRKLMEQLVRKGEEVGLPRSFMQQLLAAIHEESVRRQL